MERPTKRVRSVEPVLTPDLRNVQAFVGIQQSQCQLALLQAQLAATESLYTAYQDELNALCGQLGDVKRSHLRSGQPLWKDPAHAPLVRSAQQGQAAGTSSLGDADQATFSDMEEEVLLQPDDPLPQQPEQQQQQQQQEQRSQQEASSAGQQEGTQAAEQPKPGTADSGRPEGGAAAAADAGPVAPASTAEPGPGPGPGPGSQALAELEAVCSAVAAEDMEAQGALACLAGRAGRYYLRSALITLGRATESKGDVDLDLGPEEVAAATTASGAAAAPGAGATAGSGAAAAGAGGTEGAGAQGSTAPTPSTAPPAAAAAAPRHRVSRRAAMIRLGPDGQFRLTNTGRQAVFVNDMEVPPHRATTLPHLALLQLADVRLLFMANPAAVARCVRRSEALVL